MNSISRKLLCLLLSFALVLPAFSATAIAADATPFDSSVYRGSSALLPYFYSESAGGAMLTDCLTTVSGDAVLPEKFGTLTLRKIGENAFEGCRGLTAVFIPETVTEIAESAFAGLEDLTIQGVAGSAAQTFAAKHSMPFSVPVFTGDVSADGRVNISDLTTLAKVLGSWDVDYSKKGADLSCDYDVSIADLVHLAKKLADWTSPTLYVLGDETASASDNGQNYYPAAGYADSLGEYLSSHDVVSLAAPNLSAKRTLSTQNYLTLFNDLKAGDAVLLSFGIHDADSVAASYSSPGGDESVSGSFAFYLYEYYVKPILSRGATPILATPVAARPQDGVTFTEACLHRDYADSVRALASKHSLALVDLSEETKALYLSLGADDNRALNAAKTREDSSVIADLLSIFGAQKVAELTAAALEKRSDAFVSKSAPAAIPTAQTYLKTFRSTANNSIFVFSDGTSQTTTDTFITRESYSVPEGTYLRSVSLAEGVREIGDFAFFANYEMELLTPLPSTLVTVGNGAFHSCNSLWIDILPENLAYIGESAFYGCESLTIAEIPASVSHVGAYAFYGCDGITGIAYNAQTDTVPDHAFRSCKNLSTFEMHDFIEVIGDRVLDGCEQVFEITLPEGLLEIGTRAFRGTSIYEITIPKSLATLSYEALYGCENLQTLTYPLLATDWVSIDRGDNWYLNTALSVVNCFDGEVTLTGTILVDYHAYYSDFWTALADANANTTAHADLTRHEKSQAAAAILLDANGLALKLLKGITLLSRATLSGSFSIDLQGNTIAFGTEGSHFELGRDANITVLDTVGTGKVYKHVDSSSAQYLYNLPETGTFLKLAGGIHTCENNLGSSIAVRGMGTAGSRFEMTGGTVSATTSSNNGNAKAVQAPEATEISGGALASKTVAGNSYTLSGVGTFVIRGGTFDSYTKYGNSTAFFAGSGSSATTVTIYDGTFTTHASAINGKHIAFSTAPGASATIWGGTFTTDSKKTGDAGACGIGTSGISLVVHDAFVQGNSAGMQALGVNTTVYGGTFIGADHGGAYFAHNGDIGTIAVLGGLFHYILPDWQASTSGTGSAYFTGGGKIYIDSATFTGRQVAISNLAGVAEETTVYVSRTSAPSWRVDSFHTVYFGQGMDSAVTTGNGTVDRTVFASTVFDEAYISSIQ